MKTRIAVVLLALCAFAAPAAAGMRTSSGLELGYNSGLGGEASLTMQDIAKDLPFGAKLGFGWLALDPGDALLARRVFINNNTNGEPEDGGHRFDFRLDARYQFKRGPLQRTWLLIGPRYSMYHGTFTYVGGNESFKVTTNQFGLGAGLEQVFVLGPHTDLSIGAGLDWFANADFVGHSSVYSPDGTIVEQQDNYTYADANKAINQPRFAPRIMLGVEHHLGW